MWIDTQFKKWDSSNVCVIRGDDDEDENIYGQSDDWQNKPV